MTENRYDFDEIIDRRNTDSDKWDRYGDRDVLPLWLADMDFRSPQAVMEAIRTRGDHGVFGYTHVPRLLEESVVQHLRTHYGWNIQRDWLVWFPGIVTGLNIACRAIGEPGDHVLTGVPVYPPFLGAPANFQKNLVTLPLARISGRWTYDLERVEEAVTAKTRLFLLCNPHNPTGTVFTREELAGLAAIAVKRDMVICSDEIHCDLLLEKDGRHIPVASLSDEIASRTITLMSPSKTFNIPGLYCSFAIIPDGDLRRRFTAAMAGIVPHVSTMGYTAALAAYRDGGEWHRTLLDYLRGNREILMRGVEEMPGLSMDPVEATYLAWIHTEGKGVEDPARFFEDGGVGLAPGHIFGGERSYVRLSFGCPRTLLVKAIARMKRALQGRGQAVGATCPVE